MRSILTFLLICMALHGNAQIAAGPTIGHTTPHSTIIWYEYHPIKNDSIFLEERGSKKRITPDSMQRIVFGQKTIVKAYFEQLTANTSYLIKFAFLTRKAFPFRTPSVDANDFGFLLGSCIFTLPKPLSPVYPNNKIKVFETMARDTSHDFFLLTGDYVYYIKQHLANQMTMFRRINNQRVHYHDINYFLSRQPNYAMWDDHDFGPNNIDGSYANKYYSKKIFTSIWGNPMRPNIGKEEGIYFSFNWKDIKVMVMDNRFEKYEKDPPHQMWGQRQIEWLKNELRQSSASFKFIVSGGQMTTQSRGKSGETLFHYRDEYDSLMNFIQREKIPGVIFISGDIHSSEILKLQLPGMYPLYEYTCSALTSPPYAGFHNKEALEGFRTIKNNFGKIRIVGEPNQRICIFENYDIHGTLLWRYHISQEELK